jgi:hypothetical protein
MSLDAAIAIGVIAAGVAFGGYHYERVHLPAFELVQAEVLYEKCVRECHEVCRENGIRRAACKCSHCRKYIEGAEPR